jgi:DNA-binding SARP family transcriptional activator/tetratricopeptide (TPR) repeat protein
MGLPCASTPRRLLRCWRTWCRHRSGRSATASVMYCGRTPHLIGPRATLRRTLSALRSALGNRWVAADRTFVWFDRDHEVGVDIDEFEAVTASTMQDHPPGAGCSDCIERLRRAARLYRGPFLQGFGLKDCPDFDDWMMREAEQHNRQATAVLQHLTEALLATGHGPDAMESARRWITLDPLAEQAHRRLMLLHAWSGDRTAAISAYRSCVDFLERELGVEPLEETTELYEAILESDLPPAPVLRTATPPIATADPVLGFVGREAALDSLLAVIRRGHGLVVVEGEVGVGKTRLLEELAQRVGGPDTLMVIGWAHRMETGVAYGPIQGGLREAIRVAKVASAVEALPAAVRGQAARLIPALGTPPLEDPADPTARGRFLDGLARTIGGVAPTTILAIDNLHWTDDATLEFVSYLARRLHELGVVLVVTRRPEDTPAEHPVTMLVEDLASTAITVRLERLSAEDVTLLVAQAGIPSLDPEQVYTRTRGLPFFIVEYLAAARAGHTELPAAIRRLLLGRLSELGSIGRQVVTALAVVGTSSDFETIRSVSGRSEEEVLSGLDELVRRGMLRESGTELDFTHEQLREVAYDETTLARRRLLHRRVADHLVRVPDATRDPIAIAAAARHRLAAGDDSEAATLSLAAGDLAAGIFANADALSHYETALALDPESSILHLRVGEIRTRMGDYSQALVSFETARARLEREDRPLDAAAAAHAIGEIYRRLGRWDLAAGAYAEALTDAATDAFQSMVAASWAYVLHRSGDSEAARTMTERARESAEASDDPLAMAHAFNLSGLLAGSVQAKQDHLRRALELATDERTRVAVLNNLALAAAEAGDLESALAHGSAALTAARVIGDIHRLAALHDNLADFHHLRGDEESAMAELKEAVALFARIDAQPVERVPEVWLLKEW